MLQAHGLSKVYRSGTRSIEAVAALDLAVTAGEFVAICGHSGSGKSTLLGMLGGLSKPTGGTVKLDGADVWTLSADQRADLRRLRIGFVFQFASLLPTLRAVDNVALPALIAANGELDRAYRQAEGLLTQVGLGDRLEAYPGELSGGQQRRVALARSLINQPTILLADEPTGDLDEESEAEVFQLLLDLRRTRQTTLIVVTHNLTLARHADRVIHLRNGRIAATDVPEPSAKPPELRPAIHPKALDENRLTPSPVRLGAELMSKLTSFLMWTALVVAGLFLLNHGVAFVQRWAIQEKKAVQQVLQTTALHQLRADIDNLAYGPDGGYVLTLFTQNIDPEQELYVMAPTLRAFVQVGLQWQEVPLRSKPGQEGRVVKVAGKVPFEYLFAAEVPKFEELMPGYMHVRFSSTLLVGRGSNPADGLYERNDDYYVYLKPHGADDAAILKRTRYPGKPPVWIPMPPH